VGRRKASSGKRTPAVPQPKPPPAQPAPAQLLLQRIEQRMEQFSGPIPPPDLLRKYNDIVDNGAERLFAAFENQTRHRQELENTVVQGAEARANRGQWMGFIMANVVLGVGGVMVFSGHEEAGAVVISVDLVGLVSVFIYGRHTQRQEREKKYGLPLT
jgi:uncharacterized membrane protein